MHMSHNNQGSRTYRTDWNKPSRGEAPRAAHIAQTREAYKQAATAVQDSGIATTRSPEGYFGNRGAAPYRQHRHS